MSLKPISINDITTWNGVRFGYGFMFSIEALSELVFDDDDAANLENFINDTPGETSADEFNIEYMGYLTGKFGGTKDELITFINLFLENERIN